MDIQGGMNMSIFDKKPDVKKMLKNRDVEGLLQALEHKDEKVRLDAAFILAYLGDARAEEPFINTLRNVTFLVDQKKFAGMRGWSKNVAEGVIPQLKKDKEPNVRWNAAFALFYIGNNAVDPLIEILADEEWSVRGLATVILGKIGAPSVEPLIKALTNENCNVRWGAAIALGDIRDERAVEPLTLALKDEDDGIRIAANEALKKIKGV
jgi:HEAT repeat protein